MNLLTLKVKDWDFKVYVVHNLIHQRQDPREPRSTRTEELLQNWGISVQTASFLFIDMEGAGQ